MSLMYSLVGLALFGAVIGIAWLGIEQKRDDERRRKKQSHDQGYGDVPFLHGNLASQNVATDEVEHRTPHQEQPNQAPDNSSWISWG